MVEQEGRGQKPACQFQRDPARSVERRLHPRECVAEMKGKSQKPGKLPRKDKVGTEGLPESMTDLYYYFFLSRTWSLSPLHFIIVPQLAEP